MHNISCSAESMLSLMSLLFKFEFCNKALPLARLRPADYALTDVQTPCQKYWPHLLKMIEEGKLTPDMVRITTLLARLHL